MAMTSTCCDITCKRVPGPPPLYFSFSLSHGEKSLGIRLEGYSSVHTESTKHSSPRGKEIEQIQIPFDGIHNLLYLLTIACTLYLKGAQLVDHHPTLFDFSKSPLRVILSFHTVRHHILLVPALDFNQSEGHI